jgi:pimeloyl-ACP methyl ester carboxylesterase
MPRWGWVKPGVWGAVLGSILTMIVGFSYGGWMTAGTAERLGKQQADTAVTAALVPVCVAHSKADQGAATKLALLRGMTSSYDQQEFVTKAGWATVPGTDSANRDVAEACAAALLKTASK